MRFLTHAEKYEVRWNEQIAEIVGRLETSPSLSVAHEYRAACRSGWDRSNSPLQASAQDGRSRGSFQNKSNDARPEQNMYPLRVREIFKLKCPGHCLTGIAVKRCQRVLRTQDPTFRQHLRSRSTSAACSNGRATRSNPCVCMLFVPDGGSALAVTCGTLPQRRVQRC